MTEPLINTQSYLKIAEKIFINPTTIYPWNEIILGTEVSPGRIMFAVAPNTWRGFHKINKCNPGASRVFQEHFSKSNREGLISDLLTIKTREDLNKLADITCNSLLQKLSNISPAQLTSYNKIRKPVDIYLEHLTAMAIELTPARSRITPLLSLPLDGQIFSNPLIFSDQDLKIAGINRKSTYGNLKSKESYNFLQEILIQKSLQLSRGNKSSFHPIYFDLLWGNRTSREGGNLFLTNP